MAHRLNSKGIPVAYLVTFDPAQRITAPDNVEYFANFYQPFY